jgi:hypothetical protein
LGSSSKTLQRLAGTVLVFGAFVGLSSGEANQLTKRTDSPVKSVRTASAPYQAVTYGDLPGWAGDDHLAAFGAFIKSCQRVIAAPRDKSASANLAVACALAVKVAPAVQSKEVARAFFEKAFKPHAVVTRPSVPDPDCFIRGLPGSLSRFATPRRHPHWRRSLCFAALPRSWMPRRSCPRSPCSFCPTSA